MFGFGDDRNPSNDTVNVMEEILVEYIADVVRVFGTFTYFATYAVCSVPNSPCTHQKISSLNRGLPQGAFATG